MNDLHSKGFPMRATIFWSWFDQSREGFREVMVNWGIIKKNVYLFRLNLKKRHMIKLFCIIFFFLLNHCSIKKKNMQKVLLKYWAKSTLKWGSFHAENLFFPYFVNLWKHVDSKFSELPDSMVALVPFGSS